MITIKLKFAGLERIEERHDVPQQGDILYVSDPARDGTIEFIAGHVRSMIGGNGIREIELFERTRSTGSERTRILALLTARGLFHKPQPKPMS